VGTAAVFCNDLYEWLREEHNFTSAVLQNVTYVVNHATCHALSQIFGAKAPDDEINDFCVMNDNLVAMSDVSYLLSIVSVGSQQDVENYLRDGLFATNLVGSHSHGACKYADLLEDFDAHN
jgi:hypothetical protein